MGETRRNLFKISVLSTFGIVAVPAILKAAQTVGEHRALLRVKYPADFPDKSKAGQPADIVIAWEPTSSQLQLTAYDITGSQPYPSNKSLSDVSLSNKASTGKYPIEIINGNHTLNIGGKGAVTNGKEINGLTANAWCEVGSRRGGNSLGRPGHRG